MFHFALTYERESEKKDMTLDLVLSHTHISNIKSGEPANKVISIQFTAHTLRIVM